MSEEIKDTAMQQDENLDFTHVGVDLHEGEAIGGKATSFMKDAMRRFSHNKVAMICLVFLVLIILGAIFFPMVSKYDYAEQDVANNYLGMFSTTSDGNFHLFGTDVLGRDLWTRVWTGARVSLIIAFAAVIINFLVGAVYGGISGYCGGLTDNIMMRIVDLITGIPYMIIVMLLMMVMDPGIGTIIIAYSTVGWTGMARLVRGQVVQLKEQEFVMASKVMGASPFRILARHLIPNTLSVVVVNLTLSIPNAIFTEAFLSYIGLGIAPPQASWGSLANDGAAMMTIYPYLMFVPAIFISITMLSFNLVGDALRDAFDPKQRK